MGTSHHLFLQSRPEKDGEEGAGNGKRATERKKKGAKGGGGQLLSRAFTGRRGAPFALTTYDATPAIIMALPPSLSEFILGFSSFCPTSLSLLVFLLQSGLLPLHTPLLSLYISRCGDCVCAVVSLSCLLLLAFCGCFCVVCAPDTSLQTVS